MNIETPKIFLPRTGQTVTSPTASYAVGDDGWFQAGSPRATRFVDNGNGTITDRATRLQWVKDPSQIGGNFGTPGTPATMTWTDAVANCLGTAHGGSLEYAGFADWRLPNWLELATLYDISIGGVPPVFSEFVAVTSYYWTSSTPNREAGIRAITCFMNTLGSPWITHTAKTSAYYVRPVRGGRVNHG